MTDISTHTAHRNPEDTRFLLLMGIVFLATVGTFAGVFGFTYVQDIETLNNLPDLIWNFACGRPVASEVTLPLLMSMSIVCFLTAAVMGAIRYWLKINMKRKKRES